MTAETLPEPYLDLDADTLRSGNLYKLSWHGDFLTWMRAQGMAPNDTFRVEVFIADFPFARVTTCVRGEDGKRLANEAMDGVVTTTETMPVSSLPPRPPPWPVR